MTPYIGIYNELIENETNCKIIWNKIKQVFDITKFNINTLYLHIIQNILNKYIPTVEKVYVGLDHSSILNAIEDNKNNLTNPYIFDIINIDFHHDIIYNEQQYQQIINFYTANCANWVGFLNYYHLINCYYWYYGIGSYFNLEDLKILNQQKLLNIKQIYFDDLFPLNKKIDLLFISISPQWIPFSQYSIIKKILLTIPQDKIIYYKNPYFLSNKNFLLSNIEEKTSYFDFLK